MAAKPVSFEDWLAIRTLVAMYARAVDDGDPTSFGATFTEDGRFEVIAEDGTTIRRLEGRAEIATRANRPPGLTVHMTSDPIVEVDGDRAHHRCRILMIGRKPSHGNVEILTARYDDQLVRTPSGWLFEQRTITHLRTSEVEGRDAAHVDHAVTRV